MAEGQEPRYVFHITARAAYAVALEEGVYEAPSLLSERFIHCSTREQIAGTALRFFRGQVGLVLLCLDTHKLGDALKYEAAEGESFPHCYSAIGLDAIVAAIEFPSRADGGFELPPELAVFA